MTNLGREIMRDESIRESTNKAAEKYLASLPPKTCEPFWAISFHTNSNSPRAKRWYRVARMIIVDGQTFELYWHADLKTRGSSRADIVAAAKDSGIVLVPGAYCDAPAPRLGATMIRRS